MTESVQAFLIFCEDFRVEVGDKPIFIGVLAPVFYMQENPGVEDQVYSVTLVSAPWKIERIALKLTVKVHQPDDGLVENNYYQTIERPDEVLEDEMWSAHLPLAITLDQWALGTKVEAELEVDNAKAAYALLQPRFLDGNPDQSRERDLGSGPAKLTGKLRSKSKK